VATGVEGQHRVVAADEAGAVGEEVHVLALAGEAVQEDDGRPAARGRSAFGKEERRSQSDAVVHRDRQLLLRRRAGRPGLQQQSDPGGGRRQPPFHHQGRVDELPLTLLVATMFRTDP
jgi:hypothetical protein